LPSGSLTSALQIKYFHAVSAIGNIGARRLAWPTVLIAQLDPRREKPDGLNFLSDVHLRFPDVCTLAVSDVKINHDDERALWTATVLDLGCKAVMYPPLTRPVLEEVVAKMMIATLARTRPDWQPPAIPTLPEEAVIDLAEEGVEDE
jgi:hypothetical protein